MKIQRQDLFRQLRELSEITAVLKYGLLIKIMFIICIKNICSIKTNALKENQAAFLKTNFGGIILHTAQI